MKYKRDKEVTIPSCNVDDKLHNSSSSSCWEGHLNVVIQTQFQEYIKNEHF